MSTYGRNFSFRVTPDPKNRHGRFKTPATGAIPLGAPVVADTAVATDSLGLLTVKVAPAASVPVKGLSGIVLFEYGPAVFGSGDDPVITTYSDKDTAPLGQQVQVVNGGNVKVLLKNTVASTFLVSRSYAGRVMVAGLGATLSLAIGDWLTPGTGNDTAGWWAETSDSTKAWLVVTGVDNTRSEVEAQMLF